MAEMLIDGFRFFKWCDGRALLIVESERLSECVEYIREREITLLDISPYHGYVLDDLEFLKDCPNVTDIFMQRGFADMDGLYCLPRLRWLCAVFPNNINFALLPRLADLSTDWDLRISGGLQECRSLNRLWVRRYRPIARSLRALSSLDNLEELHVIQSPLMSIEGIEAFARLKKLELSYCRKLVDVGALSKRVDSLEELEFGHCKNVANVASVSVLRRLRKLVLTECGMVPSVDFIRQLRLLEFFSFVGTNVLDGDMTPCFGLRYAGFLNKRHYSHTFEEVRQIIERRTHGDNLYIKIPKSG
jgi:protein phosphatase 1 regulatory subunit 7